MKNALKFPLFFATMLLLFVTACEPVDDTTDGDPRDPYVGEWKFNELKSTQKLAYIVSITKDPANSSQVLLENFGSSGISGDVAKAVVTSGQMVIAKQTMSGSGWITEGSGVMSNSENTAMTLNYYFIIGADKEPHVTTAIKQIQ